MFQSTLPQGERRPNVLGQPATNHSFNPRSRRGSDRRSAIDSLASTVSIHAPAGGATYERPGGVLVAAFQSTLPQGERLGSSGILTPTIRFQSTLPQGERPPIYKGMLQATEFQSTLPQGERPLHFVLQDMVFLFQSTLPQGERHISQREVRSAYLVSIHAPAGGATQ